MPVNIYPAQRGRVIALSVRMSVCLFICQFVCLCHKNEEFEQALLATCVQKWKCLTFCVYLTIESDHRRAQKSRILIFLENSF